MEPPPSSDDTFPDVGRLGVVVIGGTITGLSDGETVRSAIGDEAAWTEAAVTSLLDSAGYTFDEHNLLVRVAPGFPMSGDFSPRDWVAVARLVQSVTRAESGVDRVLVLHGTDTMAWTAAALSFLLSPPFATEPLSVPVVLTGSNIPASAPLSDATTNIAGALSALSHLPPGVFVSFAGEVGGESYVHVGTRARKVISHGNGFTSMGVPPIAVADIFGDMSASSWWESRLSELVYNPEPHVAVPDAAQWGKGWGASGRVALVRVHPGMDFDALRSYVSNYAGSGAEAVVLEVYPCGTSPTVSPDVGAIDGASAVSGKEKSGKENTMQVGAPGFVAWCKSNGIEVVCVLPYPNAQFGYPTTYESVRALTAAGAVFLPTMTVEAAFAKASIVCASRRSLASNLSFAHFMGLPIAAEMLMDDTSHPVGCL